MAPSPTTPLTSQSSSQAPPMAGPAPSGADPDIAPKEATSRAPEESIERLQRVRANLRLPHRPFAAPSADHDAGLRALRLLDFVRLDLPSSGVPRPDLVAELIANYSSSRGRSSVRGKQIEVSLDAFAKALRLPPHVTPAAGSVTVDGAAVASASREFTKVYIEAPAEASTDVERRLPSSFFVKNVDRGPEYTTELLWELGKQEMEHLVESESTDWVSYYGAFLQRLIWVERPELFQPAPELLSVAVAPPPALPVRAKNSKQIDRSEESSKQIDSASKKIDSASEINIAASKMIETTTKQLEQAMESLNDQSLVTKERETNDIDRSEASPKQIDMASKKRKQQQSPKTERRSPRLAGRV